MSWIVNPENMVSKNSNWFRRGRPMDGALKSPFQMELRDWLRPSLWALMLFVEIFDCIEMIWHFEFLQVLFIAWIFTITFFRSNKDSRKEPWVHSAPVTTHCPHLSYFAPTEKGDWCPMISWIPPAKCHLRANGCQSQLEVSLRCSLDSPQPQLWALLDSTAGALADVIMQFRAPRSLIMCPLTGLGLVIMITPQLWLLLVQPRVLVSCSALGRVTK